MNKARRASIDGIIKSLTELKDAIAALPSVGDLSTDIERLAEEEREYYDGMPENMQGGDKGTAANEAATNLEEAAEELEELGVDDLGDKIDDIIGKLENARDGG